MKDNLKIKWKTTSKKGQSKKKREDDLIKQMEDKLIKKVELKKNGRRPLKKTFKKIRRQPQKNG